MGYVSYVGFVTHRRATVMTRFLFVYIKKKKRVFTNHHSRLSTSNLLSMLWTWFRS